MPPTKEYHQDSEHPEQCEIRLWDTKSTKYKKDTLVLNQKLMIYYIKVFL